MSIIQAERVMGVDPRHARLPHDPRYEAGSAYTQNTYRPIAEGVVPIQDAGFIHADAAYDVISASRGYVFRMRDHLERFNESCHKFELRNPYTDEQTIEILTNLVKLTGLKDAYMWWAVTRGQYTRSCPLSTRSTTHPWRRTAFPSWLRWISIRTRSEAAQALGSVREMKQHGQPTGCCGSNQCVRRRPMNDQQS